jgi:hypothetical protein
MGKNVEGSVSGLFLTVIPSVAWRDWIKLCTTVGAHRHSTHRLCPKILNNQISMSLCGYTYFMWNYLDFTLNTALRCSTYPALLQRTCASLDILLCCVFYTYWLMYGLPDDDLWKIETCWRCRVLIVKLHTYTARFIGYRNSLGSSFEPVVFQIWSILTPKHIIFK